MKRQKTSQKRLTSHEIEILRARTDEKSFFTRRELFELADSPDLRFLGIADSLKEKMTIFKERNVDDHAALYAYVLDYPIEKIGGAQRTLFAEWVVNEFLPSKTKEIVVDLRPWQEENEKQADIVRLITRTVSSVETVILIFQNLRDHCELFCKPRPRRIPDDVRDYLDEEEEREYFGREEEEREYFGREGYVDERFPACVERVIEIQDTIEFGDAIYPTPTPYLENGQLNPERREHFSVTCYDRVNVLRIDDLFGLRVLREALDRIAIPSLEIAIRNVLGKIQKGPMRISLSVNLRLDSRVREFFDRRRQYNIWAREHDENEWRDFAFFEETIRVLDDEENPIDVIKMEFIQNPSSQEEEFPHAPIHANFN